MLIGDIQGHPLFYNHIDDTVLCKDQIVEVKKLADAHHGNSDRVVLRKGLNFRKLDNNTYSIGCLSLTVNSFLSFYQQIKKTKIQYARIKNQEQALRS